MSETLWFRITCVAAAGALGALSRWGMTAGLNWWVARPWSTLGVNVLGCFLFGVLFQLMENRVPTDSHLRLLVFTGFLGAFTTYSTFAFETHQLHSSKGLGWAGLNILLHVAIGWFALFFGLWAGRAST